ncbi:beta-lactamase/transpeptidase-like protein [Trametes punicea]|nr:beta-lactamase/transpeptidase-like protein [Trametes punicea]
MLQAWPVLISLVTFSIVLNAGVVKARQTPLQQSTVTTANSALVLPVAEEPLLSPEFQAFVEELRSNASIPGISLGVVRLDDDKRPITQLASWGRKSEDGDGHDLTPDASALPSLPITLFCLASCSKAFLASSLGLLMDDFAHGRNATPLPHSVSQFDWDTKNAAVLPKEWLLDDQWSTRAASVRDILGHASGFPRHDFSYAPGDTPEDVVRRMKDLRTAYELREKWSYNNQMYILGAHIIAVYANESYADFVTKRLFKTVGMNTSTLSPSQAIASGRLTDTWTKHGRRIPFWFTDEIAHLNAGPGGVISSAEDMANVNWLSIWLNNGVHPDTRETIIPRSVYNAMTNAQQVIAGHPTPQYGAGVAGYGMGWMQWVYNNIDIVSHNGAIPGFSSLTAFSPSSNLGVVILMNADEQHDHALTILKRGFDDVLKLKDWLIGVSEDPETVPSRRHDTPDAPSLNLQAYAGTYAAPSYGGLTLCSSQSTSHYCAGVLDDFASLGPLVDATPHLYGAYRTLWSSHVRLRHHSGDRFNITFTALFPHGYGNNSSAFETYETGEAEGWVEFSVEGPKVAGFGLVIDEAAVMARQRRLGGSIEDVADAWFIKV